VVHWRYAAECSHVLNFMFVPRLLHLLLSAGGMMLVTLCAGCGRTSEPPATIPLSEAPTGVRSAFAGASAGIRQEAEAAAEGIAGGDYVGSLGRLQDLGANPELTPEQRQALAQSQAAVMIKLTEAAEAGDTRAAEAMETHRARK